MAQLEVFLQGGDDTLKFNFMQPPRLTEFKDHVVLTWGGVEQIELTVPKSELQIRLVSVK